MNEMTETGRFKKALIDRGFSVIHIQTGEKALELALASPPEFAAVQVELSGISGLEVCRCLKRDMRTSSVPVLLIGAHNNRSEVLAGFEAGASEFLVQPLDPQVFVAHVEALLRHVREVKPNLKLQIGQILMDTESHVVKIEDKQVHFPRKEFALLELFMRRPERLMSSEFILGMVWGGDREVGSHSLAVHIQRLRKKLGDKTGRLIETIHGLGYKLRD